jgi:hypothetical protein
LKHSRIIIILTAVILFFGARIDAALSLEALAAIDEMRARANQSIQTTDDESVSDQYVPGQELRSVLARYRVRVYGAPDATDNSLEHWRVSVPEPSQVSSDYEAGAMLAKALDNYRTQRKVFNLVKVMKAREATTNDDQDSEEPSAASVDNATGKTESSTSTERSAAMPVTVSSSELLTQSKAALDESVADASHSSSGYSKAASSSTNTASALESASGNDIDDTEVQKYEFKMPRNYRIMVK